MSDILEEIVAWKRQEVDTFKKLLPARQLYGMVEADMDKLPVISMSKALITSPTGIIAEFKRKSPSKGWINENADANEVPLAYQTNGAAALSILTDNKYFGGYDEFVSAARTSGVTIPVLYKNFIVDEYQLFQARQCGASAVLLIAADLKRDECRMLMHTAHQLKMEVLLEIHSLVELDYAELEPDMCGVNNRNLGTFVTDVNNSFELASRFPADICKVSESGISNPDTVRALRLAGYKGFLIGENFMKSDNPGISLKQFIEKI